MAEKLVWDLKASYVLRSPDALPKSGTKRPWKVGQNYLADAVDNQFDRIEEAMVFGRAVDRALPAQVEAQSAAAAGTPGARHGR